MLFFLATSEYNNIQSNTTKVKVHLTNGIAEILDQHQDLMGLIENNILEIETNFESKLEKFLFILQDGVFVVSNKGLEIKDTNINFKGTGVYVYARNVRQITSTTSVEEINKQYDQKIIELEKEKQKNSSLTKILLVENETKFLKQVVNILKKLKS